MKNLIFNISFALLALILMSNAMVYGQNKFGLDHFAASENKGKVFLSWTIEQGYTCNNINIYHSNDNTNFTRIGEIFGICGSVSESLKYNFTDESPKNNSVNYYKLSFGDIDESHVISIRVISIASNSYAVHPNPILDIGKIYFNKPKNEAYELEIYQMNGAKVYSSISENDHFNINLSDTNSGVYIFTISSIEGIVNTNGKLIFR